MSREISIRELDSNFVKMLSEDWALLTAGKDDRFNTMTVCFSFCETTEIHLSIY